MASNITSEQITRYRELISKYEPYPLDVLDKIGFDNDGYDEKRVLATMAKKRLLECDISLTEEEPAQT